MRPKMTWGLWPDTTWPAGLDAETSLLGYLPDYWGVFQTVESEPLFYGSQVAQIDQRSGRYVVGWGTSSGTCQQIAAGSQDKYVDAASVLLKQYQTHTFYLRPLSEFNGTWYTYSVKGQPAGNAYSDFVAAWRRIVLRFRANGVTNAKFVWNPNVNTAGAYPFSSCYPGDDVVDIVGLDGYNTPSKDVWRSPSELFGDSFSQIASVAPGKPLWICEVGCEEPVSGDTVHSKSIWINDLFRLASASGVSNMMWWERSNGKWFLNTSSQAVAAFKSCVSKYTSARHV